MRRFFYPFALAVLASVAVACSGQDEGVVFSFDDGELCEWIDADTVDAIVADSYSEHGATPIVTGFRESWRGTDAHPGCGWGVPAPDPARDPEISAVFLGQGRLLDEAVANGAVFTAHPALSDGVKVDQAAQNPVGAYRDWVPGMQVGLAVDGHGDTLTFTHGVPPDFDGDANAILSIADGLLREMGWVPVQNSPELGEQTVFRFADDDLCEWISEAEVAEFVAAEFDWDGTASELTRPSRAGCEWGLSGGEGGEVIAEDAALWTDFDGNPIDLNEDYQAQGVVAHEDSSEGYIGVFVAGHPALSDGAVVLNGGFGQFAFGVPPRTEWVALSLSVPGEDHWDEQYEAQFFAVADHFLEQLGWLSTA